MGRLTVALFAALLLFAPAASAQAVGGAENAKPVAGVTLRLYAHNNAELASVTSDAEGESSSAAATAMSSAA